MQTKARFLLLQKLVFENCIHLSKVKEDRGYCGLTLKTEYFYYCFQKKIVHTRSIEIYQTFYSNILFKFSIIKSFIRIHLFIINTTLI